MEPCRWSQQLYHLLQWFKHGNDIVIDFVAVSDWGPNLYIDDLIVEAVPACPEPTQLSASNITSSSADVSWIGSGSSFVVEYGPTGFVQGTGMLDTVTTNTATLTGLASNTEYDAYVLNDCSSSGNGISIWSGPITFRTLCNAHLPEGYFQDFDAYNLR
jgi:hypothetical protein